VPASDHPLQRKRGFAQPSTRDLFRSHNDPNLLLVYGREPRERCYSSLSWVRVTRDQPTLPKVSSAMQNSIVSLLGSHLRNFWMRRATATSPLARAYDAPDDHDWTNIYRTPQSSLLFRNVLADEGDAGLDAKKPDPSENARAPTPVRRAKIGEVLGAKLDVVRQAGKDLALLADPHTAHFVNDALASLNRQFCRVAFVGQMNSGKSSLINVLTQRPDFLPTDINPWTTVVTNLYFGAPDAPHSGAVFRFFNRDEWRRLAQGSPRIKELTKRLMPDFDWNSFAEQVNTIRDRARERLGDRFEDLAGQDHQHANVTKDLLERYICAGSPFDATSGASGAGEYSGITKVAELYFDLECFNFPTILVDTPGVNDPFLVRDEITRQNLELADIYVVVLTARQPLSHADLNLLRLLKGLNKERIVVFVNKVDELETIGEHAPEIVSRIKDLLAKELRLTTVPVILGSALWAKAALAGNKDDVAGRLASSASLAGSAAATLDTSGSFWLDDASDREVKAGALLTRSGTLALAAALSDLMQTGQIPKVIGGVGGVLITIAKNAEAIAGEHAQMAAGLLERLASSQDRQEYLFSLRGRAETIKKIETEVSGRIDRLEADLHRLWQDQSARWRSKLRDLVAAFAEISGLELLESCRQAKAVPWRCNTLGLRCDLEAEMSQSLNRLQADMSALQQNTAQDLHGVLGRAAGDLGVTMVCGPVPFRSLSPSMAPLSGMVAVDADSPVWMEWWSRAMPAEARVEHLRLVIDAEFGGICEQLIAAADSELFDLTAYILDHFRIVIATPLKRWHERVGSLIEASEGTGAAATLEADVSDCRDRQTKYAALITAMQAGAGEIG
jgi:GTP-binding protein EngB required for normal cell division